MDFLAWRSLRLLFFVGASCLAIISSPAIASPVPADFLDANLNDDGSIFIEGSQASAQQSTVESLLTLRLLNDLDGTTATAALASLQSPTSSTSTELLAHWVTLNAGHADYPAALAELSSRQNMDGGFGHLEDFSSDPLNTSVALSALKHSGYAADSAARAVSYLLGTQSNSGAWNFVEKDSELQTIELTAVVANALWHFRKQFGTLPAVDAALSYLNTRKSGDLWPTTEASALALHAIINRLVDRSSIEGSVAVFTGLQAEDGSFDGDVYSTALGLRVLRAYASDPADISVIRGRVIDAEFGAPIANASIEINGAGAESLLADSDGFFTTTNLLPGTYDVEISQSGFSRIAYKATISEGTKADLGQVRLSKVEIDPVTGEPVVTGFVRGVIRDRATGNPISGAIVTLPTGQSALTNADGQYSISGVQPGQITVSVAANSYQGVQGVTSVGERQTIVFSPLLNELDDPEVRISGVVTDRETGALLAGVVISVSNGDDTFDVVTDASGVYDIGGLPAGALTIQANRDEYHPVIATAETVQGSKLNFSPAMDLLASDSEPQLSGFKGQVVDAVSGVGLSGVSIQAEIGTVVLNITTDDDGLFEVADVNAEATQLNIDKDFYFSSIVEFDLAEGVFADIGKVELLAEADANSGSISGRIIDVRTGAAIAGAMVTARSIIDNSVHETFSEDDGSFSLAGIGSEEYEISLSKSGYVGSTLSVGIDVNQDIDLGEIRMREPGLEALLPDLSMRGIDKSHLTYNQSTFDVSGVVEIDFVNQGNAALTGQLDVIVFQDLDGDSIWSASDVLVASEVIDLGELAVDGVATAEIGVSGVLSFYQAPLLIALDPNNLIAEISDANNIDSTASTCSGAASGPSVDLALCMDASGSVNASEFRLQQEGVAQALEDTNIIPRDGSVRVSIYHFATQAQAVVAPTIIDDDTVQQVIDIVRTTRLFSGSTYIDRCINLASADLAAITPQSALQVIDVSTDGNSSGNPNAAATSAVENGIDVINGIAIGSGVSISRMEPWVRPQPAGGDRGFVVEAPTFDEYIQALSDKIVRETKIVDLNLGGLKLIDNGDGAPSSVSFVLGNSGAGSITEDIVVSLYIGDEAIEENKVGSLVFENGLSSGSFAQALIEGIDATLVSGQKLLAVAELETGFAECDTQNNRQIIEVSSLLGDVSLSLSEMQYPPNSLVDISGAVNNIGGLIGNYQLQLTIEDASDHLVFQFDERAVVDLAPGSSSAYTESWDTAVTLAGEYKAVARLFSTSGELLDTAEQSFTVGDADLAALFGLNTNTDKPVYNVNDQAILEVIVQNLSRVTPIANSQLRAQITDPTGSVILDELFNPAAMVPGQVLRFEDLLLLSQAPIGAYSFKTTLLDSGGDLVATSTSEFEVVDDPRAALVGTVAVEQTHIDAGAPQVCSYSLSNQGLGDLSSVSWFQVLVKVDDQQELERSENSNPIASSEQLNDNQVFATGSLSPGGYACVLEAVIEGEAVPLASATFVVDGDEQAIQLAGSVLPQHSPRVLALIDGFGGDEPGAVASPNLNAQVALLEDVLASFSVNYTIVSDVAAFEFELLTGNYNQFTLLSENASIPEDTVDLLASHIFLGDGLLVTSAVLAQSPALAVLAGAQAAQQQIDPAQESTQLKVSGEFSQNVFAFSLEDLLTPLHINNADVQAHFEMPQSWYFYNGGACVSSYDVPAISSKVVGSGKVVLGGFDWLLHAASEQELESLLIDALTLSAPSTSVQVAGEKIAVTIQLSSNSGANGEVRFVLPEGVTLAANELWVQEESTVSTVFALSAGESVLIELPIVADVPVSTALNGSLVVTGLAEQPLEVALNVVSPIMVADLSQALTEVEVLYPSDPWVKLALHAESRLGGSAEADLVLLLEAQQWLDRSENDLSNAQEALARLIVRQIKIVAAN